MNPFDRNSLMTPSAYIFLVMIVSIPVKFWYPWFEYVSYSLFALAFAVAFLWNNLYLDRGRDNG